MTDTEKLISSSAVLEILRKTMCEMACKDDMITAVINLPRHTPKPKDEGGLREAVSKCPVHNKAIDRHGDKSESYTCEQENKGCVNCPITEAFMGLDPFVFVPIELPDMTASGVIELADGTKTGWENIELYAKVRRNR